MNVRYFVVSLAAFLVMDVVSYFAHRYVFHGFLWCFHQSHHASRKGWFEKNDFFSLFFASIAIALIALGMSPAYRICLALGIGMTAYGLAYFAVHEIYTHRRLFHFELKNGHLNKIRQLHRVHHQSIKKPGQEPFGFLWFKL